MTVSVKVRATDLQATDKATSSVTSTDVWPCPPVTHATRPVDVTSTDVWPCQPDPQATQTRPVDVVPTSGPLPPDTQATQLCPLDGALAGVTLGAPAVRRGLL